VEALALEPGMRVLEIGCGPGAMAREMARLVAPKGYVLAIDRSARAIATAKKACAAEIKAGTLSFRLSSAEEFVLEKAEAPFDLAVAVRVGALDGRHPELEAKAKARIAAVLVPGGRFLIE